MSVVHWIQKYILKPLDAYRKMIYQIYNQWFRPVIKFLETLQMMVRYLAIFDRKLAALIDAKLAQLETWVMTPISNALKRINSISSYIRAILTPLGMIDRVLLIESLRRDASILWETITNPRARIFDTVPPAPPRTNSDRTNDFADFVAGQGGTYADSTAI